MTDQLRRAFDWLFRDRRTGRIVVAQVPNAPLVVFLVSSLIRRVFDLEGTVGTAVGVVATGSLLVWAADEVVRGVNPFRRALGALVAVVTAAGLIARG